MQSLDSSIDQVLANRGGETQRAQYAHARWHRVESKLGELLYSLFAWGLIPAVLVQKIAQAAQDDFEAAGASAPELLNKMRVQECGECIVGRFGRASCEF